MRQAADADGGARGQPGGPLRRTRLDCGVRLHHPIIVTSPTPARRLHTAANCRAVPTPPSTAHRIERFVPWLLRGAWLAVVVLAMPALDGAFENRSDTVHDVARIVGAALWVIGVAAMAVPAVVSLTATRVVVPLAVPVSLATAFAGADLAVAALGSWRARWRRLPRRQRAELGRVPSCRRPPTATRTATCCDRRSRYLALAALTWSCGRAPLLAGPLLLADRRWVVGGITCALAVAGAAWAWRRWHRLSRRWFVLVPTGVVVHDQLVLGETLMVRRNELAAPEAGPGGHRGARPDRPDHRPRRRARHARPDDGDHGRHTQDTSRAGDALHRVPRQPHPARPTVGCRPRPPPARG